MDSNAAQLRVTSGNRNGSREKTVTSQQERDEATIARFGKKQQLRRRFTHLSSIGLTCGLMLTWESLLFTLTIGLTNGGPAGLVYGFIAAWIGATLQAIIFAEMASMIPLAGGPFNWVSILAPPEYRKILSYLAGWLTVIAWQAFVTEVVYYCGLLIQSLIILSHPEYDPQEWHGTMLFYAVMAFGIFVNTVLGRILPRIESLLLIFYILGFFAVLIPLVYLAPHKSADEVFTVFQNGGGWNSNGLSFFVGWLTCVSSFIGFDGADHMAEEIKGAQKVIPFTMIFSTVFNGLLGFSMLIAILFCMGSITDPALTETTFPFITIFTEALGSVNGGLALSAVITAVNVLSASSIIATASRMLWAFSRENGIPFSNFIVKVDPKTRIPLRAIGVTVTVNILIALISIGSETAFAAFLAVPVIAYFFSFLLTAGIMLHKRLTTPSSQIPWGPLRLGKAGPPLTVIAMMYTVLGMFFSVWPSTPDPTPATMNYSSLIFGSAILFSMVCWVVWGRKVYTGPIWEFQDDGEYVRANEIALK